MNTLLLVDILSLLLSGQRFSSTTHLIFSIAMQREKKSLNAARPHPSPAMINNPHMQHSYHPTETSDLVAYDHILSTSSIGFRNEDYGGRNSTVILSCAANQSLFLVLESGLCKVCLGRPGEVGYYRAQCVQYVCSHHSLKWQHTVYTHCNIGPTLGWCVSCGLVSNAIVTTSPAFRKIKPGPVHKNKNVGYFMSF